MASSPLAMSPPAAMGALGESAARCDRPGMHGDVIFGAPRIIRQVGAPRGIDWNPIFLNPHETPIAFPCEPTSASNGNGRRLSRIRKMDRWQRWVSLDIWHCDPWSPAHPMTGNAIQHLSGVCERGLYGPRTPLLK